MNYKRLLRIGDVIKSTGLSRSTIYLKMAQGDFPNQHELTERCVAWDEDEIQEWILSKLDKSNKKEPLLVSKI